ncbi:MAG: FtsX-like permease family protein, partial [Firmicutes bacterium]|nr:FtsX-like permease family protein [Bacillota bacterium]
MNILNRLTLRNLRLNKKRTIVTIIGIILSGAMICGVASLVASFQDLFIQSAISTDGNYHATFHEVPYEDSKYLSDNINTKSTLLTQDIGFAELENAKDSTRPFIFIMAYNGKAFTDMPITLKEGRFPEKNSEIVVSEQLLSNKSVNYKIGQEITLPIGNRIDNGELLSPKDVISKTEAFEQLGTTAYTITGVIEKPRFEPYASPAFTAISYLDEGTLAPTDLLNVSILTNKPRNIYKIVPQMAEAIGINNFSYNNELLKWMGISKNSNYINMLMSVGLIIIGLIVVGSVTVIYNAFAISVSERKKQFGMLSSVGATAKQIRKTIFFEGFLLGIIGIPIGILSGILGIGVTIKIISPLMQGSLVNTDVALRLVVSPLVVGITVFFVAFVILISAYIPAKRASSISPIEAIRLNTDINIKGKKLKTSKLTRLLFGFEGEIALKNLKRNRRRYRATVFSLFISIVLFISFSTFTTYGFQSSKMYYSEIPYDIYVNKYDAPIDKLREFYNKINELEDIDKYVILRNITVFASESNPADSKFGPYTQINFPDKGLNNEPYYIALNIYTLNDEAFNQYMIDNNLEPSEFKDEKNLRAILINKSIANYEKY